MTFSYYYKDPDGNHVELQVDNFGDWASLAASGCARAPSSTPTRSASSWTRAGRRGGRRGRRRSTRSTAARWPASSRRRRRPSRSRRRAERCAWSPTTTAPGPRPGVLLGEEIVPRRGARRARDAACAGCSRRSTRPACRRSASGPRRRRRARRALRACACSRPRPRPARRSSAWASTTATTRRSPARRSPSTRCWFAKFANSLIGDGAAIVLPGRPRRLRRLRGRARRRDRARGRTPSARPTRCRTSPARCRFNDVSARDLQLQNPLWTSGKAIDTFAPCGPALVTLDEVGDLGDLGAAHAHQRRGRPGGHHARHDLRRRRDDRLAVAHDDARARGHHRHRHAGGRRRRSRASSCATATRSRSRSRASAPSATRCAPNESTHPAQTLPVRRPGRASTSAVRPTWAVQIDLSRAGGQPGRRRRG